MTADANAQTPIFTSTNAGKNASANSIPLAEFLRVVAVTSRSWINLPPSSPEPQWREAVCDQVRQAIAGGATAVIMREKNLGDWDLVDEACALAEICQAAGIPLIVNDEVAVAVAAHANGLHVGKRDMGIANARAVIGAKCLLGVTVRTVEEALQAQKDGADYLTAGVMFPIDEIYSPEMLSVEALESICQAADIPVIAFGGIRRENVEAIAHTGICGVAALAGIFGQPDIENATRTLRESIERTLL